MRVRGWFPLCMFVKCHLDLPTPDKTVCSASVHETRSEAGQAAAKPTGNRKQTAVYLCCFVLYLFFFTSAASAEE